MKTLQELAKEAIDVQDACNLSGVIHSWAAAMNLLRDISPTASTESINRHPISKMWAYKCADLSGLPMLSEPVDGAYDAAYQWCKDILSR